MQQWVKKNTTEGLRKPKVSNGETTLVYGGTPSTTPYEEICRRIMVGVLPGLANTTQEIELIYNMYSGTNHESDKDAKKQEKQLKPLENAFNALAKVKHILVQYLGSHNKLSESENPVGTMVGGDQIPVGDRMDLDPDKKPDWENGDNYTLLVTMIGELSNLNNDELMERVKTLDEDEIENVVETLRKIAEIDDEPE